ncbi:MAG TPA: response regulator [Bacteroidales bacterium]|nr:response regulator [Bacteroidales bacterium]
MKKEVKIVVAEGNNIYRESLITVLSKMDGVIVIGDVSSGIELMEILKTTSPHLILLDIELPGTNGITLCNTIVKKFTSLKIIGLTTFSDLSYTKSIINAGVNCFLKKNISRIELEKAITTVIQEQEIPIIHINQLTNNLNLTIMKTTKILLVDDDVDIIYVLQAILTKNGYSVITANDKIEGMKKLREEKPDLAILDVMMTTQYEGFEMAKEINDDPELKKIPILMQTSIDVLVTTNSSVQDMAREFRKNPGFKELYVLLVKDIVSNNAGIDYLSENGKSIWFPVDGFLSKPVDVNKLIPEIEKILKKRNKTIPQK